MNNVWTLDPPFVRRSAWPARTGRPRVCIVGPMVGRHHGRVTHQGEILADALRGCGYQVTAVSAHANRYRRLAEIVATITRNRDRIDVLIVQVYGGPSFVVEDAASLLGRQFGLAIVMVLHGGAMPAFTARFPRWSRRVLRRADVTVAPSKFLARALEPGGVTARVIPNVIHLHAYPHRHRAQVAPRLLWMRSFHDTYNPLMAVRTLARVREVLPAATLVMAGQDSGQEAEVRSAAAELGLGQAIRFAGFLDAEGKLRESETADIFLNTNRIDNMPVAIVEMAAFGLPVVSTNVGGIPDLLVNDQTGLLVPDDDDAAMAAAIERLVRSPELASRLSANGRRLAEHSAWDAVRPKWERALADAQAALSAVSA